MHVQHVAVELGGHAGGVVVGGHQAVGVLHQVGAEQERVARLEAGGDLGQELGARSSGSRLPIVLPRNATSRRPPPGSRSRWRSKSPTTAWTSTPGTRRRRRRPRCAASPRSRRTARSAERARARASASSSSRVFSDVPDPSSIERVGAAARRDLVGARVEDRALGACRVVLGQAGDLVEQLGAAVVVEPLGGSSFGVAVRPARTSDATRRARSSGVRWTSTDAIVIQAARCRLMRPGAAEAGEDLAADRVVPVAERGAHRRPGRWPTTRRAAPCTRHRRTPRSTRGTGTTAKPG